MLFFVLVAIEKSMRDLRNHVLLHYESILEVKTALAHTVRDHIASRAFSYPIDGHMDMLEQMLFV